MPFPEMFSGEKVVAPAVAATLFTEVVGTDVELKIKKMWIEAPDKVTITLKQDEYRVISTEAQHLAEVDFEEDAANIVFPFGVSQTLAVVANHTYPSAVTVKWRLLAEKTRRPEVAPMPPA